MVTPEPSAPAAAEARSGSTLYEGVAERISQLIEHGTLRPGERVPSVRRYSEQADVSIATVMQAYRLLENRGLVEARPQSGYYVRLRRWTAPPEPEIYRPKPQVTSVRVSELVLQIVKAGFIPGIVRLGTMLPSPELFPARELNRLMAAAGRRLPHESHGYLSPAGHPSLRQQIAQRAIGAGCTLAPDDIVVTCGASEALNLCLRAVAKPGDTIAIESPTFFGILQIIEALGMRACEVPTYPREGICLDELAKRLKYCRISACLFTPNFSNPLGSCMPDEKKKALVQMLAKREIPLIEDDIYGNLTFGATRPKVCKAFDTQGWVMTCDSFSKTVAPGYRVGWVAPGRFREKVEYLKWTNTHSTSSPPQLTMADFLKSGGYDRHLRKLRRIYSENLQSMTQAISGSFPPGTKDCRPSGGMALWVELPTEVKALELHRRALAEKISIAPGPIFSARQGYHNFIRLNIGNPWTERIEAAVLTLGKIVTILKNSATKTERLRAD
jgi:DNA-binding transcriptional MocR family regulator